MQFVLNESCFEPRLRRITVAPDQWQSCAPSSACRRSSSGVDFGNASLRAGRGHGAARGGSQPPQQASVFSARVAAGSAQAARQTLIRFSFCGVFILSHWWIAH
jgi:hypothetical protein